MGALRATISLLALMLSVAALPSVPAAGSPTRSMVASAQPQLAQAQDDAQQPPQSTSPSAPPPQGHLFVSWLRGVVGEGAPTVPGEPPSDDLALRLLVENSGEQAIDSLTVSVEVFDRADSRNALHRAVDRAEPSGRLVYTTLDVQGGGALAPGDVVALPVTLAARDIGWSGRPGVYPLRISLLQGHDPLDETDTAVVLLDHPPATRLLTVVGWPLDAPPARSPDGTYRAEVARDLLPGGRLERLVWGLEQDQRGELQPLVAAQVVEDLTDLADGFPLERRPGEVEEVSRGDPTAAAARALLARLRATLATRRAGTISGPYADAEIAALQDGGLTLEALQDVSETRRILEDVSAKPSPDTLWATTRLTPAVLHDVLVPSGVRTLLLGWEQLAGSGEAMTDKPTRTPEPLQAIPAGGPHLLAAVADPWLQDLLAHPVVDHGSTLAAQRILAETAMVHFERPNAEGRGLVLLPPADWAPPSAVISGTLEALRRAPWLEMGALDDLVRRYGSSPDRTRLNPQPGPKLPPGLAISIRNARERLAALHEALPDVSERIQGQSWDDLDRALLRASSSWWTGGSADQARAAVSQVVAAVDGGLGRIALPDDVRITLTDPEGTIPVTVARPAGGPISVIVVVESPKLDFPEGDARLVTLAEGAAQTISFRTVAQASGRIPVTVQVKTPGALDPAGTPWVKLAEGTLVVQSTAISGNAVAVLGVTLTVLFAWWLYRKRRPRRPQLTVVREEVV